MKTKDEILQGLSYCSKAPNCGDECPYYNHGDCYGCVDKLLEDALELIRSFDTVNEAEYKPYNILPDLSKCSKCGAVEVRTYPYCPWCGARMTNFGVYTEKTRPVTSKELDEILLTALRNSMYGGSKT